MKLIIGLLAVTLNIRNNANAEDTFWTPNIKAIPEDKMTSIVEAVSKTTMEKSPSELRLIPWPWIQENCNRRASITNYALAALDNNMSVPTIEDKIDPNLLTKITKNPSYESAQIRLTGPLMGTQVTVRDSDQKKITNIYSWDHHVATLVLVGKEYKVIDISLGKKLLSITDWIYTYIPKNVACPQVNVDTYAKMAAYYSGRQQFPGTKKPTEICGFIFMNRFESKQDSTIQENEIEQQLIDSKKLLLSNSDSLISSFPSKGIDQSKATYTSKITPMSETDFCKKVPSRWCATIK